jgi:cytochrome c553
MLRSKLLLSVLAVSSLSVSAFALNYSQGEIYQVMCSKCHGKFAEGMPEKKGPALTDMSQAELAADIFALNGDDYQSSGSAHEGMEENLRIIRKKGMDVDADKMAKYIYTSFGTK